MQLRAVTLLRILYRELCLTQLLLTCVTRASKALSKKIPKLKHMNGKHKATVLRNSF